MLNKVYKEARVRLQMSHATLLRKLNDDDKSIFKRMKAELSSIYEKIKQSPSCIDWLNSASQSRF